MKSPPHTLPPRASPSSPSPPYTTVTPSLKSQPTHRSPAFNFVITIDDVPINPLPSLPTSSPKPIRLIHRLIQTIARNNIGKRHVTVSSANTRTRSLRLSKIRLEFP